MPKTKLLPRDVDRAATRGGRFLRTLSTKPEVRAAMNALGYTDQAHRQGWDLYLRMSGYKGATRKVVVGSSTEERDALRKLDAYDEQAFARARSALEHLHPDACRYMFGGRLKAASGFKAILSIKTFLDRYAAMRDGTDAARSGCREADAAAARTLEARNIVNPSIERDLRALLETATRLPVEPSAHVVTASEEAIEAATLEFMRWLKDWRTTAAEGVARRDHRIMLGVAHRRASKGRAAHTDDPADGPDE